MGEVFSARDGLLNRRLSVKALSAPNASADSFPRFLREAQVTAQLSHPNVVPAYGIERSETGQPTLSMKLIQDSTFHEYIRGGFPSNAGRDQSSSSSNVSKPSSNAVRSKYWSESA